MINNRKQIKVKATQILIYLKIITRLQNSQTILTKLKKYLKKIITMEGVHSKELDLIYSPKIKRLHN